MNTKDLINAIHEKTAIKKANIKDVLDVVMETVAEGVSADGVCRIGKHIFKKKEYSERAGRNPKTGESLTIPARTFVTYRQAI